MARSSHGSRRATTWAVTQRPAPRPRVVRLGRAANDNARLQAWRARLILIGAAAALLALAAGGWMFG